CLISYTLDPSITNLFLPHFIKKLCQQIFRICTKAAYTFSLNTHCLITFIILGNKSIAITADCNLFHGFLDSLGFNNRLKHFVIECPITSTHEIIKLFINSAYGKGLAFKLLHLFVEK